MILTYWVNGYIFSPSGTAARRGPGVSSLSRFLDHIHWMHHSQ